MPHQSALRTNPGTEKRGTSEQRVMARQPTDPLSLKAVGLFYLLHPAIQIAHVCCDEDCDGRQQRVLFNVI
jgi:hypothetical protein